MSSITLIEYLSNSDTVPKKKSDALSKTRIFDQISQQKNSLFSLPQKVLPLMAFFPVVGYCVISRCLCLCQSQGMAMFFCFRNTDKGDIFGSLSSKYRLNIAIYMIYH